MQAATFWRTVTMDHADLLKRALRILEEAGARYWVIGGQAVNAYARFPLEEDWRPSARGAHRGAPVFWLQFAARREVAE